MKKNEPFIRSIHHSLPKVLKIMKLSIVLILFAVFQVNATDVNGQNVNLHLNQTEIRKVLSAIEKQSGIRFLYNYELSALRKKVNFNAVNTPVPQALDQLLGSNGLTHKRINPGLVAVLSQNEAENAEIRITGKVTGANNEPLAGVSISEKGTSNGTSTDGDGNYSLTVANNAVLQVTFIGYITQEIPVNNQSVVNIQLQPSVVKMDEVVVVGYGQQRRTQVTQAISSVKAEELATVSSSRIEQALQGRTAGVTILPISGSPGNGVRVRIRGTGSNGPSEPLYIVDGVRAGGIEYLDPSEIASVDVLKDAASAAIYGAEGANGVVLITTKTGRRNASEINYSMQLGRQTVGDLMPMMNAQQYQQYLQESNTPNRPTPADVAGIEGTDWFGALFQPASLQRHTLNFSGGSDKSTYLLGGTFFTQEGIAGGDRSSFDRYTVRLNSDHRVKNWLNVGNRLSYSHFKRRGIPEDSEFGSVVNNALMMDPITPVRYTGALPAHVQSALNAGQPLVRDANGNYYGISPYIFGEVGNPLAQLDITHVQTNQNKVVGNVYADIEPIAGLKFTSRFGIDAAFDRNHGWTPRYWFSSERLNTVGNLFDWQNNWFSWQWENFATYTRRFNEHGISLLAGTSALKRMWNYVGGTSSGLFKEEDKWAYSDFTPDILDRIGSQANSNNIASFYGRVNYDFRNKYLLSATLRRDGASMLPPDNQWGTFPSVSAGWLLSNEDFYSSVSNVMNFAKLRGSWGRNGSLSNLGIGMWQSSIGVINPGYYTNSGYLVGAAPSNLENTELQWETSEQFDIGADLGFFNNRLSLTVDYYRKTTKDLITPGTPPLFAGNTLPFVNGGDVRNTGWEFDLSYRNRANSLFTWEVAANLTTIKNEVTYLNPNVAEISGAGVGTGYTATVFQQGYPIWYFRGYKTAGIFQDQAEVNSYLAGGLTGYTPKPGDPVVVDVNGDNVISASDQTYIGSPHPEFVYGARATLGFKGFDFLVFLQGQAGNDIFMGFNRADRATANKPEFFFTDRWTGKGSTNEWPSANTTSQFVYNSDLMIFDGSYARIRQLQLGYTLPNSLTSRLKIRNARAYISFDNFFTFTNYPGLDPEAGSGNAASLGIDRGVYPIPRTFLAGLSFSF